jgi:cellulose synthase/poly-beta-1,6-N-acetylglucosamine synthase-like glycosyltransferase
MYHLAEGLFWIALTLLLYAYLVYPVLVVQIAWYRADEPSPVPPPGTLPLVTVIVAAFNEEAHIAGRIENLLWQDYPPERLQFLIGSDGSTDRTVALAREFKDPRVRIEEFSTNRGKSNVLNDLVALADGEIVVFTDANTVFEKDTVRQLVVAMDERTGAVCGELILERSVRLGSNSDHLYWTAERRLKAAESKIGALLGANGGVYAIRRACYRPLRPDTICDDFVIVMNIAQAGLVVKYAPAAVAYEDTPRDVMAEFHRRSRIGIGNYQALFRHPEYLFGGPWAMRFSYFSHKVLRWLTPHLLLTVLVCSLLLASQDAYEGFAILQLVGYAAVLAVYLLRDRIAWPRIVRTVLFFVVLNAAFIVGFKRFVTADYQGSWRRVGRT